MTTSVAGTAPATASDTRPDGARSRDRDVDRAEIAVARDRGRLERVVGGLDEHALGERAEGCGDRGLVPGRDLDGVADESADAVTAAGDERGRRVADLERAAERRRLCGERADLALGGMQPLPERADLGFDLRRRALRRARTPPRTRPTNPPAPARGRALRAPPRQPRGA